LEEKIKDRTSNSRNSIIPDSKATLMLYQPPKPVKSLEENSSAKVSSVCPFCKHKRLFRAPSNFRLIVSFYHFFIYLRRGDCGL